MKSVIFLVVNFLYSVVAQVNILCTNSFCEDYTTENPCVPVPDKCRIQNGTHNGIFLPWHGPCNCCDFCLENLALGEACAVGSPSSSTPTTICGPVLSCQEATRRCGLMDTACTKAQKEFDRKLTDGTLGHLELRPDCDNSGFFKPFICIPGQNCFCVDKDGKRIFGDVPYSASLNLYAKCECSRKYEEAKRLIGKELTPLDHFRCKEDGNYDVLQCIGDKCTCIHDVDGSPMYLEQHVVNITQLTNVTLVPCYNQTHLAASKGKYYYECEENYLNILKDIEILNSMRESEVIGTIYPDCQPDGKYSAIQIIQNSKTCVDSDGKILEDFAVALDDPLAKTMNCRCARARSVTTTYEKPECCKNGNYLRVQCRRNLCRCVDSNGLQIEKEVPREEISSLKCTLNGNPCTT